MKLLVNVFILSLLMLVKLAWAGTEGNLTPAYYFSEPLQKDLYMYYSIDEGQCMYSPKISYESATVKIPKGTQGYYKFPSFFYEIDSGGISGDACASSQSYIVLNIHSTNDPLYSVWVGLDFGSAVVSSGIHFKDGHIKVISRPYDYWQGICSLDHPLDPKCDDDSVVLHNSTDENYYLLFHNCQEPYCLAGESVVRLLP